MSCWGIFEDFLFRWQTLITGVLALVAAVVALRPVYGQLKLMREQNKVMLRSTINEMMISLDRDLASTHEIIDKRFGQVAQDLGYFEDQGDPPSIAEWASERDESIRAVIRELKEIFFRNHDAEPVEEYKGDLILALDDLSECLDAIYTPQWHWTHPDHDWSEDEEKKAVEKAKKAEKEVRDKVRRVAVAAARLSAAREGQRAVYSHRLRAIDDALLV
ncbi:hypothetical protein [Sphingopyxis sp. R3-92]|uniref:hypothetical protein n=1 Tax=Sphingopyxis sp. R3-92 TaxID=3158553 RepID=UPI003EE75F47